MRPVIPLAHSVKSPAYCAHRVPPNLSSLDPQQPRRAIPPRVLHWAAVGVVAIEANVAAGGVPLVGAAVEPRTGMVTCPM